MASLVHLTPERNARAILRSGVAARSRGSGVFCMAVLPSYAMTHQWMRELRRWNPGVLVAVDVRIPDDAPVTVGRYNETARAVTAAEAVGVVRAAADPRGFEIFVPRAVEPREVRRVRPVAQGIGWRYEPDAHGRRPCPCPGCIPAGSAKSMRLRRRLGEVEQRSTKPELMARLRAASTADDVIDVLCLLGTRSRGGAEELAYLVAHPDPEVREFLRETLDAYRGRAARALRERLDGEA